MHWLEEWRLSYTHKNGLRGMTREDLAARVRKRGVPCSEDIIAILERQPKGVTHPKIADKIVEITGGTQEHYDSIVAEIHRGKRPTRRRRTMRTYDAEKKPQPIPAGCLPANSKTVVQLDASGCELERYESAAEAARQMECSSSTIQKRCARMLGETANEFLPHGCTFRYAAEWDAMTADQRAEDMRRAGHIG